MRVHFKISALKATKWYEYALRFLFGGTITVVTGVLANHYGPVFGGLFLAFPAIFPASATLVEKHEREKKQRAGIAKTIRGREAAALDARGAAIGSLGLIGFAFTVWRLAPIWNGPRALFAGSVVWMTVSILIWRLRRHRLFLSKGRVRVASQASHSSKGGH
jgi:succinate-acetate transporter protein